MGELERKTEEEMRKMRHDFIETRSSEHSKRADEPDRKGAPCCQETGEGAY